ncbi:transposase, partial [bacterium]|nr:transposase [bacterium]
MEKSLAFTLEFCLTLRTKWKKLSHTIYQCKYHIVWCPKYRYRILKGAVAEFVEQTLRMLCEW